MSANDQFDPSRAVPVNSAASQKPEDDFNPGRAVPMNADNALVRGWKSMSNSVGITKDLATGDAAAVARRVKEFDDYNRVNPGSQQGQELSKAWEQGDGITGGIAGVAGEIAKDWKEAPNWVGGVRSVAGNAKAMGDGLVAQVPNMLAPMVGMVGGGVAGGAAAGPVGLAAGAWAGASAGNTLVEGGGMLMDRLNKAGINPQDTAAVEKFTREQGDAALGDAAIKGAIIGAVDAATAGAGGKILNAPARAAADRALTKMGVDMTDGAAVKAAQKSDAFKDLVAKDATFQAASSGAGNVARNVGVAALDPAGEFAGEFVGQGVATGDWDTKNAALEAISSVGQSAIMYGGQKAYQAATSPLRDKRANESDKADGEPEAGNPVPLMLTNQPPDTLFTHPDGSTGRRSEMESYLNSLNDGTPAGERRMMKERARLLGYSSPEPYEFEIPDLVPWQEDYRNHSFGLPYQPLQDHLGAVQAAVRSGTQFTDQQTVDAVRSTMEDAWLEANVKQQPASAVEAASIAGQQMEQELAAAAPGETGSTAAVDAQVRTSRILSGLQNAMDSGAMGTAQSINYLNEALTRIGEQPLAQDEAARARRLLDAHAAFTGKTTPAPLPGDFAAQNPLVDEFADNAALESLIRRKPSERLGIDPSAGPNSKAAAMAVDAAQSEPAAPAIDAAQPLSLQNPLLAISPSTENAAPAASPFNINGDLDGREAYQAQQIRAQQAQARAAQGSEAGGRQDQSISGIGSAPGHLGQGVGYGTAPAINNGPQVPAQNATQGQASEAQTATETGSRETRKPSTFSKYAGQSESSEANGAINSEAKQAAQPASDAMTIGSTPKTGDAVSVRDGVVYLGNYEALDYDSGEPIKVPAGATRGQVAQALRDGGVLTDRQKVFGLKDREHERISGPVAPAVQAPAPASAPVATAPAPNPASLRQQKAIERINSEKGAYFFSKSKADAFLADNDLQDGYEVVQQEKAFAIKAKQAIAAAVDEEAPAAGAAISVTNQNSGTGIAGRDLGDGWAEFAPESGTKSVPRAEMPQIKAEHRGAMVNFMNARGVAHEEATVPASSLKPTQREFSREKVEKAKAYTGGNRSILTSNDGHVLDGHHQWVAALENGEDVRTIRLDAPIDGLVELAHEFPSSTVAEGAETGQSGTADKSLEAPVSATQSNVDFLKALAEHRKDLPEGFEIVPMGDTISLKEGGKFAVNGLSRDRAGMVEALRLAKERDQKNKAGSASTAPEHGQAGVDDRDEVKDVTDVTPKSEQSVVDKMQSAKHESERAAREAAAKKAAEQEARKASREVERDLFRQMTAANGGMAGKSLDQVTDALKQQLGSRDASTALNPVQISRLGRAIHKQLQTNAAKLAKEAARDPQVKADAQAEALGNAFGEDVSPQSKGDFLLGFDHALAGKTKSTLSGAGLADMVKGYEAASEWMGTEEGAAWFEGTRRKKLENTGVDLRRHWEAMKAQMKAGESDMQKAWKQIEAATNRAELFAPYLPEGSTPGWVAYVTQLRGVTKTFKQFLFDGRSSWYGSVAVSRKGKEAANLEFVLDGKRYPGSMSVEQRQQWQTDPVFRMAQLRDAAELYIEKVQELTAFLDGATSLKEAADRFVDTMVAEKHQEKARNRDTYYSRYERINADRLDGVLYGVHGGGVFDRGVWNGDSYDFTKFRAASPWASGLIANEATHALPTRATPLTPPKLDRVDRAMPKDHRGGKDVTPAQFKAQFGFADVGFGNWVGAKNDQDHLNYAFDAFMDLAEHFGFAPKNIGLGGVLHFTVGALGHGKFAAHFSPNHPGPNGRVQVMNLTNTKGDGTVYHEWAHALDHNLGGEWDRVKVMILNAFKFKAYEASDWERVARNFLVGGSYWQGNKNQDKVDAAIQGLRYYANTGARRGLTAYKENADKLGKDYWGNDAELLARAVEAWSADSLGGINSYLVNQDWVGDGKVTQASGYRGTPYPTGGERVVFGQYLTALAKSVKFTDGKPTVTVTDFERNLPANMGAGEVRRRELLSRAGMQAYFEQVQEERAMAAEEKARLEREKQAEDKAKVDAMAEQALAELDAMSKPAVVDAPAPSESRGPLSDDDLSAIFDQAAAELREQTQEQPNVSATNEAAAISETVAASVQAAAGQADKTAAKLIAEAAKLGVTGANEALSGLAKLFGGGKGGRLNSFPAGFDEETYKAAKPHFKAALSSFQAAGKSLKDLFKLLIQNFGDGVKDYAIQFAKDEGLSAQLGKAPTAGAARSPSGVLADWVKSQLERGAADGSFDWRALFEQADSAFGGTQAEGKYTPKDAYDAMEAGVNHFILSRPGEFNPNASQDAAHIIVERLHRITQMLPTQTKRTAEQDEFQQFSTVPALAYAANWAANMDSSDTMLEPSAGIGGLAAFAKNAGAKLILNELSSRRAAVLREVFPAAKVFTENAEQIDNILPATEIPSVVVMNPPFSATAGRIQGKRDTHVGAQHVEQGLKRLADGGRLVAIVGEGMNLDRPAFADWWKGIRAKYDVRAVIPMDGSGYAKYGTTFDNAILVIDKVKPSNRPIVTTPAKTYSDLIGSLAEIRNDRPESIFPSNDRDGLELDAAEHALAESSQAGGGSAQPEQSGRDQRSDVGRAKSGRGQGLGPGSGGRSGAGGSGGTRDNGSESGTGRTAGNDNAGGGRDAAAAGGSGSDAAQSAVSIQATEQTGDPEAGLSDSIFESYQPQRLQVPGAKPHPGPLVQSSAMAAVLPPVPTYTPNLPKETIEKGLLSIAQIEAVVYAGQAHQELLEPVTVDGKDVAYRRGFFIGDGTGVGKGREISGIILDNMRQGREKAVWISEKPGLMPDAQRDFSGIGGDPKQIFNVSKTKAEEQINADRGIAFLSYATLRSGAKSQENVATPITKAQFAKQFPKGLDVVTTNGRGTFPLDHIDPKDDGGKVWVKVGGELKFIRYTSVESIGGQSDWLSGRTAQLAKGSKKEGQSRLDQLVNWLGKDFDGVIAFDEAHNAGNAVAQKGTRGQSQPSAQALAVVELQKRLPNARVVYVSATGATQVSNLSFATRLGLWGPATPFASVQNFIAEMTAGGLAAMELVARDLKQMGAYMARSLSFEGVTYSRVEHQLSPLQQDIYNRLAEAWQVTLQNIDAALKTTGAVGENGKGSSSAKSAAMSAYWGAQQRFFSQVITSMQMPSVLEQMERDVADGKALVLQLVNTNEAQQNRSIAKRREEDESSDLEELDLTPRDVLMQMVEKSFPVTQFEEQEDDSGKKIRVPAKDSQGNPVINREAVAMREALLKDLKDIRVPDGPLEIVLNHFGVDKVAEVTGRTQRVVRKLDKDGELRAQLESRGPASARADANAFMADQKPILVFSDAGGTGYSFHADNTQKNKRKRSHYLIQPGWRADKAVQGFGRTHRTNQASAPHYYLASTNVPSQKRFLSAIARRLDQLGALTKGQRDTANQGMFSEKDNLESIYATQAVQQFFKDGQHQQLDGISFAEFLRQTGLESIIDEETNRIAEDRMPDTRTFLNRMLSLKLDMQEKVFDAFMLRMEEKVEMAVERGEFDAGLQTIRALESRVVADDLAYTDPRSGAETRLVELELTQPTTIYPFPHSLQKAEYVVNVKSGKVYAKTLVGKSTTKEGAVVDRFRFYGTGSVQSKTAPEIAKAFRGSTKAEAMKLWAAENEARPKTYTERKHMIVGAMLPIWDRLKTDGSIQVARTMTVDGSRLLGRVIDKKSLPDVRKRLNVSSAASKMSPAQVMAQILKGDKAELANGWSLERARVSDDLRIELKNPSGGYISPAVRADLVGIGLVSERISWAERLFVPTGAAGVPVLERLTKNRPVVDLQSEQDTSEAHFGHKAASPLDTFPAEFMAELAAVDDLFVNPRVNAGSAAAALRQVDASIQFVGDVTAEDERSESGADTKLLFRTGNGRDFYVFEKGNELWLDVSRLGEGDGGSTIYAALMDYAAGNDMVFIGDPAGLSDIAMRRRLEAMISSAIKHGSTGHMEPHARQVEGDEKLGIPALKWRPGDTIGNIQRMIDVSLASISAHVPEFGRARYDFATGTFRTGTGKPLPDGMLRLWSEHPRMRAAGVGRRSIKRGILLNTLAHGESRQRPGLLEQALRQPGQLVGEQAKGIFYTGASRSPQQPGSRTDRAVMDMVREGKTAADILGLIASTSKTPFNRKLADILVKTGAAPRISMGGEMGGDGGFTFLAKYSRKLDELSMSEGAARQAEQIFLHEMTHAATLKSLDRKGVASLQMRKLYEHVKKQGGAAGAYGMKNVGEFVAEAFTNPEFQRVLRGMSAPAGSTLKNAWAAFVRALKSTLGLPAKSEDALSRALELGVQVMREDKALRHTVLKDTAAEPDVAHFGVSDAAEAAKNIGQGLKAITATDVKNAGSHKLTDWLKLGLQFMGRRQLVDIYGDTIPMAEYDRLVAQMEADKNDVGAEADNLATRWGKLKDEVQLSELMHDATLAEIDADSSKEYVEGDNKAQSAALKRRFSALSPEAKAVYREARDHYREHHKQVRNAIRERIMRAELSSNKRQELLEKMDADFFGYVKGVYFPLARFGQYVVATKDQDGKVISVSRAETMTEAERMRDEMRKAFPVAKGFNVGRVTLSKDFVATHDMVGRGFMSEVFAALDKHEIPADKRAELEDTLGQLYLSSLPDLSWAKHGIHRKGTPGFSQDARRAFAQNSFHGARYLAKLRYSDLMADELDNMQKHVDTMGAFKDDFDQPKAQRVVDEMQKRHDQLMNPKTNSLSTALTSFGFIFHLGLSPAAAMVNLSQTALVAYPVMGAKWGFQKSAAALLRASNESVKGKNDIRTQLKDKDELAAYDEAVRSGVIDVTMAHDLAGIAQGEDAGVMWKLRPVMRAASFLFHHAERFNRQATFIAAYRLARDAGSDHYKAYEEAVKATYDGHFDYGSANRPRLMQGNVARVVLLFKQFAQNMIYTLGRNAYLAAKGDKQALKTFAGVITMHAAGAGVLGLPLVGPLLALASALGGDDDDPWDAEIALRNMMADVFGQQVSEVIAKGFSRLTPWDISGRIGLDNLIFPDIREGVEGKMWAQEMATGLLGPVVGIGINAARGGQLLAEGDYMRGLENMMPVVPRNAIKSARFLREGAKDASGIIVKDEVSSLGIAGQLVGFSPSEVRLAFEGRGAVMNIDRRLNTRRAELLGQFAHAVMKKDSEGQVEAREEIKNFNEKNPGRRITSPQLWQSVRARQRRIDQAEDGVYLPRNRRDAMDAGNFAF